MQPTSIKEEESKEDHPEEEGVDNIVPPPEAPQSIEENSIPSLKVIVKRVDGAYTEIYSSGRTAEEAASLFDFGCVRSKQINHNKKPKQKGEDYIG